MTDREQRRPAAFRLDDPAVTTSEPTPAKQKTAEKVKPAGRPPTVILEVPREPDLPVAVEPNLPAVAKKSHWRWASLFFAGLGGLVSLGIGLMVDQLIRDLFARTDWLGWIGIGLVVLVVVGAGAIALKELVALMRLARITKLNETAREAAATDDRKAALAALEELIGLYRRRPETARGRAEMAGHMREIVDGRDLIRLGERELMTGFDADARRYVMESAKRVSIVTAVSPRAIVDVLFVLAENLRLIRRLSELYGGRPGTLGLIRLARNVIGHLALTGGMAIGDSLVQQLVGQGLAAKLSARLGEGVVNGMLTARVGIAAIDVCRPLPFIDGRPPALPDVVAELAKIGGSSDKTGDSPAKGS